MIKITGFSYVPSTPGHVKQGVKNHQTPRGAVAGGNGSFVMMGDPPKIILGYDEDGFSRSVDIYPFVKYESSRRITEKYAREIYKTLDGKTFSKWEDVREAIFNAILR